MISPARWEAECIHMANRLPQFKPLAENGVIGFYGVLRGPRTKRIYKVVVRVSEYRYPQDEPKVYMDPHAEGHHWIVDPEGGHLCYLRTERPWKPSQDTFLKTLLVAVDYLKKFD